MDDLVCPSIQPPKQETVKDANLAGLFFSDWRRYLPELEGTRTPPPRLSDTPVEPPTPRRGALIGGPCFSGESLKRPPKPNQRARTRPTLSSISGRTTQTPPPAPSPLRLSRRQPRQRPITRVHWWSSSSSSRMTTSSYGSTTHCTASPRKGGQRRLVYADARRTAAPEGKRPRRLVRRWEHPSPPGPLAWCNARNTSLSSLLSNSIQQPPPPPPPPDSGEASGTVHARCTTCQWPPVVVLVPSRFALRLPAPRFTGAAAWRSANDIPSPGWLPAHPLPSSIYPKPVTGGPLVRQKENSRCSPFSMLLDRYLCPSPRDLVNPVIPQTRTLHGAPKMRRFLAPRTLHGADTCRHSHAHSTHSHAKHGSRSTGACPTSGTQFGHILFFDSESSAQNKL